MVNSCVLRAFGNVVGNVVGSVYIAAIYCCFRGAESPERSQECICNGKVENGSFRVRNGDESGEEQECW